MNGIENEIVMAIGEDLQGIGRGRDRGIENDRERKQKLKTENLPKYLRGFP